MNHAAAGTTDLLGTVRALERKCEQLGDEATDSELAAVNQAVYLLIAEALSRGHAKFAELASIVEVMLGPVVLREEPLTDEFRSILRDYLKALKRLAESAPLATTRRDAARAVDTGSAALASAKPVFLLEPDEALAQEIFHQAGHFGYSVHVFTQFPALLKGLDSVNPAAMIMDLSLPGVDLSIEQVVERLRAGAAPDTPILGLTEVGDVETRLRAARADVAAFFVKPVDMHDLVDRLDTVTEGHTQRRFRVVIVEDSRTQAAYYSAILQRAGMDCAVVGDPMKVLDVLGEQPVDLILMDMYMPGCTGVELAKVVRQFPMYESIPIVFLSAETEIDRQLDAMSLGADDFLTKPIDPAHLIRSVAIRAERARTLRSFMITDNLTGLLNHTRIKEQLHNEVARAQRNQSQVAFAMLDIDRFKAVNDTHGHQVGDRVIKTLARVLRQRLRETDFIGRYGGEEFAVVLPDAGADEAIAILDGIRESFRNIRHFSAEGVFNVSFSGGVVSYPRVDEPVELARLADVALYKAKRAGRDRIAEADPDSPD